MADRLLMEDLKETAYRMLVKRLTTPMNTTNNVWVFETKTWEAETITEVDVADMVQVVRLVYRNTGSGVSETVVVLRMGRHRLRRRRRGRAVVAGRFDQVSR